MPLAVFAQTKIVYHKNKYKLTDDVKFGRQGAADYERQFPLLHDKEVDAYVEKIGQRLVASIPREFQHPEFRYYFKVINARDVNAFALPGGPMYVNRGMIEAADNEGEIAGFMAHELSHVALRHGTAKATNDFSLGFLGPRRGFSRQYETEADLLGARIMANAGYDPQDLANMFRTIEQQGGGGGGFLRGHPSPAHRYERINQEAQYLQVNNPIRDNSEFLVIKERLLGYPRAQSIPEIQQSRRRYPNQGNNYPNRDRTNYPSTPPALAQGKTRKT
jgi:predicted Zn-dependent protease